MRHIRKNLVGLIVAAGLTGFGTMAFGQSTLTPYSPNEAGPAMSPGEEVNMAGGVSAACVTPYSPNECGPSEAPAQGGTAAPELGGAININGASLDRLPVTPDSDWAVFPTDE